jgi:hypothetical protein
MHVKCRDGVEGTRGRNHDRPCFFAADIDGILDVDVENDDDINGDALPIRNPAAALLINDRLGSSMSSQISSVVGSI